MGSYSRVSGDEPIVEENRNTTNFARMHYSIPGTLPVTAEQVNSIGLKAQQSIFDVIET